MKVPIRSSGNESWIFRAQAPEDVIAFHATAGGHHFLRAVRAFREVAESGQEPFLPCIAAAPPLPAGSEALFQAEIQPLLLPGERGLLAIPLEEAWEEARSGRRCLAHRGLLQTTDRGMLAVRIAPLAVRDPLAFAIATTCLPSTALQRAVWRGRHVQGVPLTLFSLDLLEWRVEVALASEGLAAVLRQVLRAWPPRRRA